jgi:hypothetical protein
MFARTPEWWELRTLRMPEEEAATPKRFVVLELDGTPQAYGIYRSHPKFEDAVSKSRLEVVEAFGATPQAIAEIWRFLLDIDWSATVETELLPPDHPLFMLLAYPRRARYRMYDGLWVRRRRRRRRRALGPRVRGRGEHRVRGSRCRVPVERGPLEARGRSCVTYRRGGGARTRRGRARLCVSRCRVVRALRDAGRVEEVAECALRRADALFGWRPLPWCPEIF